MSTFYVTSMTFSAFLAQRPMEEIQSTLKFKKKKIEEPEFYLGAKLEKKKLNGKAVWTMSSSTEYAKASTKNVKEQLQREWKKLAMKAPTPMVSNYYPEMDSSPHQNLIHLESQHFKN